MSIFFTQFKRPDGHETVTSISRPAPIEQLAKAVEAKGCRFEAEVLMNGVVSFEVVRVSDEDDDPESVAIELVPNGPGVLEAVDKLVQDAYRSVVGELPS